MRSKRSRALRVFFATDVHGSDVCFRKFLAAAEVYDADVLILGGDLGGKGLVPVVATDGHVELVLHGKTYQSNEHEKQVLYDRVRRQGIYPVELSASARADLDADPRHLIELFSQLLCTQLRDWCDLADERLRPATRCIITPGNDDPLAIDGVLQGARRIECPEHALLDLGPVTVASMGEVPPTPWNTERELSESALATAIDEIIAPLPGSTPLVMNFHSPPWKSGIDDAPEIDEDLRPVVRGSAQESVPVGSKAVRAAIEKYEPVAGLHGHIHEGRGFGALGRTICINPGSSYSSGILDGALIDFAADGEVLDYLLTSG